MKCRWLFAVLILTILPIAVVGATQRGYIKLTMMYDGAPVAGGSVTLYDVSDLQETASPEELAESMEVHRIAGLTKPVDGMGIVMFEDMFWGRYLLVQNEAAEGFYPMKPFVVALTEARESVDARPKLEPIKKLPQTGQLVWPAWVLLSLGSLLTSMGLTCRKRG